MHEIIVKKVFVWWLCNSLLIIVEIIIELNSIFPLIKKKNGIKLKVNEIKLKEVRLHGYEFA